MPPPPNHFLRFGLPFLTFMIGGHQALTYIMHGRNELKDEQSNQQALLSTQNKVVLPVQAPDVPQVPPRDYEIVRISRKTTPP